MHDSDARLRAATLQKYTRAAAPRHEPEVEEAAEAYEEARAYVRQALMLDVRLADGTVESFAYASLRRARLIPGDTLLLQFDDVTICAEGRNLSQTRDAITEHRRRFIQEGTEAEDALKPEEAAHIERITFPQEAW